MKVCYLTHTLDTATGAGAFSERLIRGLQGDSAGLEATILTSEDLVPPSKWRILKNLPRIRNFIGKNDIVHALDGFPYGLVAYVAALGLKKKIIITAIGTGAIQKLNHPFYGPFLRRAYRKAAIVTAPSKYVASELERAVPGLAVKVITHGVDYSYWSGVSPEPLQKGKYILSVGAIKRRKGYHFILSSLVPILREDPDLLYVIVGKLSQSPDYAQQLTEYIEANKITSQVRFLSGLSRDEIRNLYGHARIFVLAPQNVGGDVEGFGLAFLEAAAAGAPSLATKGSGADDAILEGKSGYLVDPRDNDLFRDRIKRVIESTELRDALSRDAQEFARSMDWSGKIKEYKTLYEAI